MSVTGFYRTEDEPFSLSSVMETVNKKADYKDKSSHFIGRSLNSAESTVEFQEFNFEVIHFCFLKSDSYQSEMTRECLLYRKELHTCVSFSRAPCHRQEVYRNGFVQKFNWIVVLTDYHD